MYRGTAFTKFYVRRCIIIPGYRFHIYLIISLSLFVENSGSAVYMSVKRNRDAAAYTVAYQNDKLTLDGYIASGPDACDFTWSKTSLGGGNHTVIVEVLGRSSQAVNSSKGTFELNNFMYVFLCALA